MAELKQGNMCWTWLSKDRNNKALSSVASIVTIVGIFAFLPYAIPVIFGFFGSVNVISYDSERSITISNDLNSDVLLLDVSTKIPAKDWWFHNKQLLEVLPRRSLKSVEFSSSVATDRVYIFADENWDDALKKSFQDGSCLSKIIYSKENPQLNRLTSSASTSGQALGTFDVDAALRYTVGGKEKTINFPATGTLVKDINCRQK